jgi:hypothetical protein
VSFVLKGSSALLEHKLVPYVQRDLLLRKLAQHSVLHVLLVRTRQWLHQ